MELDTIHWKAQEDELGVLWLAIDVANSSTNSLSAAVLEELEIILREIVSTNPPAALIIYSAKANGFIAGADVTEFSSIKNEADAIELITRGQGIISQLANLPCPTIAVIDGFCLGGGLELALACDYRIAIDTPTTRLGLPEIKLGIHPGFGGTLRSISTIGSINAMQLMLTGRTLSARQAQRMRLVDERIPKRQIQNTVAWYIQNQPAPKPLSLKEKLIRSLPARKVLAAYLRRETVKKANPKHYPAPFQLIDLFEQNVADQTMLSAEAASVAKLITTPTARNLVRVFQLQEQLKSHGKQSDFKATSVHVVGAGTMGGDIAIHCALNGLKVTLEDANNKAIAATFKRANKLFSKRFRDYPHLKTAALDRMTADGKGMGRAAANVIIEAIFENLEAKQLLFKDLEKAADPGALLATNTSSIPLEEIAATLDNPKRLVGLHFFNPVAKMPLVEVVESTLTYPEVSAAAAAFAHQIGKLPLPVNSSPGFLVNRVLMPYLLEAAILFDENVDIAVIDHAAKDFGMPMGPLELADTVGLDICLNVAEELAEPMNLSVPESIRKLVSKNRLGKKSGHGFYHYKKGKKVPVKAPGKTDPEIQNRLISKLLEESQNCLDEQIVNAASDVDAGVIFGTGFAPFTGGPLHYQAENG